MKRFQFILALYLIQILFCNLTLIAQNALHTTHDNTRQQDYNYAFNEATKYYLFGNYVQAVGLYRECLKIRPGSAAIHFQLAKIFLNSGNTALAREYAKGAVFNAPDNVWYLRTLGDIFKIEEKYDSAISVYQVLLTKESNSVGILYEVASLYQISGNFDQALKYYSLMDEQISISKEVSINRFRIYNQLKKDKEAISALQAAYILSDGEYAISGMMAEFYRARNMPDSAMKYYQLIYPAYRSDGMVVFSYSEFLMELKESDSAKHVLFSAMQDSSMDMMTKAGYFYKVLQNETLFSLFGPILQDVVDLFYKIYFSDIRSTSIYADVSGRLRNYGKASEALLRIVNTDKNNYLALEQLIFTLNIADSTDKVLYYSEIGMKSFESRPISYLFNGSVKMQRDDYLGAIAVFERGLKYSDDSQIKVEFYTMLAECYQRVEMYEKSASAFEDALRIDPENLPVLNNYAYYLSLQNKSLERAEEMSKKTIDKQPGSPTYLDTYAWILYKMGKFRKAKKYISLASSIGGEDNPEIVSHKAEILIANKDYPEAVKSLKQLLLISDEVKKAEIHEKIRFYEAMMEK